MFCRRFLAFRKYQYHKKSLEFQSYFQMQKSFWCKFKANLFLKKIKQFPWTWFHEGWILDFGVGFSLTKNMRWHFIFMIYWSKGSRTREFQWKEIFKAFILLIWIIKHIRNLLKIWFCMGKHCLPTQIACLWLENTLLGM
jgi:hypothetical protein